jgi:Ni/Co efflux regulator RcnB
MPRQGTLPNIGSQTPEEATMKKILLGLIAATFSVAPFMITPASADAVIISNDHGTRVYRSDDDDWRWRRHHRHHAWRAYDDEYYHHHRHHRPGVGFEFRF